jgi:CHAD domain-containing protein
MRLVLKRHESVPDGMRRLVHKRIDHVLETLADRGARLTDDDVHDLRKCCKEVRGILRLARGALGNEVFKRENRAFRDAARPLSKVRDAKVLGERLESLLEHFSGSVAQQELAGVRRVVSARREVIRRDLFRKRRAVSRIRRKIRAASKRVDKWPLRNRGWRALEPGVRDVYRRGRRAMKAVQTAVTDEGLHEWRKRAKDLRYQLTLLLGASHRLAAVAHRLTDLLGEDHDLAVLQSTASQASDVSLRERDRLADLVGVRRATLQQAAFARGEQLYAARTRDFVSSVKRDWNVCREDDAPRRFSSARVAT